MPGTFTITGSTGPTQAGEAHFGPRQITGAQSQSETLTPTLAGGDNTFAIPAGTVAVLIIPPETNTATLKVRTSANNADQGLPVSPALPFVYPFPTALPATLIINASGSTAALTIAFI